MFHNRRFASTIAAAAIGLSALTVPAATAAEATPVATATAPTAPTGTPAPVDPGKTPEKESGSSLAGSSMSDLFRNDDGKIDPKEITAWIGVITAILGVVSTAATSFGGNMFR